MRYESEISKPVICAIMNVYIKRDPIVFRRTGKWSFMRFILCPVNANFNVIYALLFLLDWFGSAATGVARVTLLCMWRVTNMTSGLLIYSVIFL